MLEVTEAAKEKLREGLRGLTGNPEMAIRVVPSSAAPNQLEFVLDREREGDQVLSIDDGTTLLVVGSDIASALNRITIDYQGSGKSGRFIVRERT